LNVFGLVALFLVSAGLYGITSFSVSRRTTEIGIRMALGARRFNVAWLVQRETLGVVLGGSILGAAAAAPVMMLIRRELFGLAPNDPLTMVFGILLVTAVASCAAWLPARRAARVDPMIALRIE
jgi:ABC-type antimicrobial peptide transport system permease subunit